MKPKDLVLIFLSSILIAMACISSAYSMPAYVGIVIDKKTGAELRTVISTIPDSRDNAFNRSYDIHLFEQNGSEQIGTKITGSALGYIASYVYCPTERDGALQCGGDATWPFMNAAVDAQIFPLVIVGGLADVALLPVRIPFILNQEAKHNKGRKLLRTLINTDDNLSTPPSYEIQYVSKISHHRFTRLTNLIKEYKP